MNILVCSDGMPAADNAARVAALLAPTKPSVTLLGIAEKAQDEPALREALNREADYLRQASIPPETAVGSGEPVRQIAVQTTQHHYDLVIIGARRAASSGSYWRSRRSYEVIKSIEPPVLVAIGACSQFKKILVCTGGKSFIEQALEFTGKLAAPLGASITLLHVLAEPPVMYADLVRMEEDVERLLNSGSELGTNLAHQKKVLEQLGVQTDVRVRHGIVLDHVFAEAEEGGYDMIVTGSSRARGMLGHYMLGDLTREILNHSTCPVLVARGGKIAGPRNLWRAFKRIFARQ